MLDYDPIYYIIMIEMKQTSLIVVHSPGLQNKHLNVTVFIMSVTF